MTKVKRQKNARKIINFYKNNFNFNPPYNILIDGTFCKEALACKINIQEQLPKYLESEIKLLTTKCAKMECNLYGSIPNLPLYGASKVISQYEELDCFHKVTIPVHKCFKQFAKRNKQYFIATQDNCLREKLRELAGVPILYISYNAINLEPSSQISKQAVENSRINNLENDKLHLQNLKFNKFGHIKEKIKKDKVCAKGPNPLSCKKKKKPHVTQQGQQIKKKSRKRHSRPKIVKLL